jgi:SanA protein
MNPSPDATAQRRLLEASTTLLMTATGAGAIANLWVLAAAHGRCFRSAVHARFSPVAIVPGAKVQAGEPSPVLAERLEAALALQRSGRVNEILVSGGAALPHGDETATMVRWLVARGVPSSAIQTDSLGLRTWATMRRAREVFGIGRATICSQGFHLPRCLFLAARAGIDAIGLIADAGAPRLLLRDRAREFFARQLAVIESTLSASNH